MSVKPIFNAGRLASCEGKTERSATIHPQITQNICLLIRRSPLLFQFLRHFELSLAFRFATSGDVRAAELIMYVSLIGFQTRGNLEILDAAFHVAFLQQCLAQFVTSIGELRL